MDSAGGEAPMEESGGGEETNAAEIDLPSHSTSSLPDQDDWKRNEERRKRREERFGIVGEQQKAAAAHSRPHAPKEAPRKRYKINEAAFKLVEHAESIELTEEDLVRAAKRAKRFQSNANPTDSTDDIEHDMSHTVDNVASTVTSDNGSSTVALIHSLEPRREASSSEPIRKEALYMHGLDELSTDDVAKYFLDYSQRPDSVEWIDDSSAVILFSSEESALSALEGVTVASEEAPPVGPDTETLPWHQGKRFRHIVRVYHNKKRKRGDSVVVDKPSSSGNSSIRSERHLSFRRATTLDVRPPKDQRKRSEYYAKLFGSSDSGGGNRERYYGTTTTLEVVGRPRPPKPHEIQVNITVEAPKPEPKEPRRRLLAERKDFLLKMIQKTSAAHPPQPTASEDYNPTSQPPEPTEPVDSTRTGLDAELDELEGLDAADDLDAVPDDLPDDL
eukprot:TRINITY_DN1638_c0_g3_i1.p1 TRINITY_DN1638_c0_g3~~TRINITY_DN1638_c0_g3_i1.p1  ORF type:complete len:446 (+),score=84.35 TRINITY_DN1638_c0_g3_i1:36-1373(+)